MSSRIELVVFDWAGTTVDFGCFAPVSAFIGALEAYGVELTPAEARGPMGLHKQDHIRELLRLPRIAAQWREKHGSEWTEANVREIYERFTPMQAVTAAECSHLIEGTIDTVQWLREREIQIGSSTGYPRSVAEGVLTKASEAGYTPDHCVCSDEVAGGRPSPWMVFRNMELASVFPASSVVKVGDTVPDIQAGLNAGAWSIGIVESSSEVGRMTEELASLEQGARAELFEKATQTLTDAGAHMLIGTVAEVPKAIGLIEAAMNRGDTPQSGIRGENE